MEKTKNGQSKHAYDPDGLRGAGKILKSLLDKLDNSERATIVKKIELYLKSYVDRNLVKEMTMAFKSIGQRMGFVSIADAERMAEASGRRKERAKNKKDMDLFVKRIAKKTGLSQEEILALKP